MARLHRPLTLIVTLALPAGLACTPPQVDDPFTTFTTTTFGDGDGDPGTTGDGDGDGDTGDGDPTGGENCGDAVVQAGEQCDLGPDNSDAGVCTTSCNIAVCGDGLLYAGFEECDDGNPSSTDDCVDGCKIATCGDGFTQAGVEECDDANMDETDGCTATCTPGNCGDGIIQQGEQCDDSNMNTGDNCPACQLAFCGDGYIQLGVEICDDGNILDSDLCVSPFCVDAFCGDGYLMEGVEACDDNNMSDGDACPSCQVAFCGDGFTNTDLEECDDADNDNDNDCANDCTWNQCQPLGPRAPFNTLGLNTASGCWDGNPCPYDQYSFESTHGQNYQGFNQAVSCTGAATCVAHVGITTYAGGGNVCQGTWDVYCDGNILGTIDTLNKSCTGSAMANNCSITFPGRVCTEIELRAKMENDGTLSCCAGSSHDSMLTGVSAW
jgi:cysteine-rich repeat protein